MKAMEIIEKNQYQNSYYHPDWSLKVDLYISIYLYIYVYTQGAHASPPTLQGGYAVVRGCFGFCVQLILLWL